MTMGSTDRVRTLLDEAARPADRREARAAWARETAAAWREALRKVDAAWDRILGALPDDISDEELEAMHIPDPPEQAEVDALHALLWAVKERDVWPRELYWGGV
jgi:hypothetical protein